MFKEILFIFWTFFKIGLFTIGGGYAMIPMIESEVLTLGWISEEELLNFLAISESTPGPFAINIATFIGYNQSGILGAIFATLGVVLPSIIIIICIYKIYTKVIKNKYFKNTLNGIKGVVIGLIFAVGIKLILNEVLTIVSNNDATNITINWTQIIIFAVLTPIFILFTKKKISPILFILIGAAFGIIMYGCIPLLF